MSILRIGSARSRLQALQRAVDRFGSIVDDPCFDLAAKLKAARQRRLAVGLASRLKGAIDRIDAEGRKPPEDAIEAGRRMRALLAAERSRGWR